MRPLAIFLLLAVPSLGACGGAQTETTSTPYRVERGESHGFTRATLRDIRALRPDGGVVGFEIVAWEGNPVVQVKTTSVSSEWRYRDCKRMAFVADGKPVPVDVVRHEGEKVGGQVVEHLVGDVKNWRFRQVAKAQSLQAELCKDVVQFEEPERQAMAKLVRVAWEGHEPTVPEWLQQERRNPPSYDVRF